MAVKVVSEIPGLNMEDLKLKGFKVHELPASVDIPVSRGRRDFYKMGLVTGNITVYYDDKVLEINDTVLFFINPNVPHSVVRRSKKTTGYACLFTETFISSRERAEILKHSPLFHIGDTPVIPLNSEQAAFMTGIFGQNAATSIFDLTPEQRAARLQPATDKVRQDLFAKDLPLIYQDERCVTESHFIHEYEDGRTWLMILDMDTRKFTLVKDRKE